MSKTDSTERKISEEELAYIGELFFEIAQMANNKRTSDGVHYSDSGILTKIIEYAKHGSETVNNLLFFSEDE